MEGRGVIITLLHALGYHNQIYLDVCVLGDCDGYSADEHRGDGHGRPRSRRENQASDHGARYLPP